MGELNEKELMARMEREQQLAAKIVEESGVPYLTAVVMAGDQLSREVADRALAEGRPFRWCAQLVGSYARLAWIVDGIALGRITSDEVLDRYLDDWRDSDPDDTDRRFLALWQTAFRRNGRHYLRDGRALPKHRRPVVYRGQLGNRLGIAWTLDPKVAARFAATGGGRAPVTGGVVIRAIARRESILAYITGRKESEVVVDPTTLDRMEVIG